MPIYEYSCGQCEKLSDVLQKVDDPPPARCEHCGAEGKMTRVVSRTSFVLKGGGWYSDLYGSTKKEGSTSASSSPKDASASATPAAPSSAPAAASPAPSTPSASAPAAPAKADKK